MYNLQLPHGCLVTMVIIVVMIFIVTMIIMVMVVMVVLVVMVVFVVIARTDGKGKTLKMLLASHCGLL